MNHEGDYIELKIEFVGPDGSIPASQFASLLSSLSKITEKYSEHGYGDVALSVRALERGSLLVELIPSTLDGSVLFGSLFEKVEFVGIVLAAIYKLFQLKRGKPVSKEEGKQILSNTSSNGNIINLAVNIYNNDEVRKDAANSLSLLGTNPSIQNTSIKSRIDGNENEVTLDKDDLSTIAYQKSEEGIRVVNKSAVIQIDRYHAVTDDSRIDFFIVSEPSRKKKSGPLLRAQDREKLQDGTWRPSKNSRFGCTLEITEVFDEEKDIHIPDKYRIVSIDRYWADESEVQQLFT